MYNMLGQFKEIKKNQNAYFNFLLVFIISSFLDYFALYRSKEIFHYHCFFQLLDDFGINFYLLIKVMKLENKHILGNLQPCVISSSMSVCLVMYNAEY